jgi:hypothetical protein
MLKDPLAQWEDVFPYDALSSVRITPTSSAKEIMDASFELMEKGQMTPQLRQAWDDLRITRRRLLVDFFLYRAEAILELTNESFEVSVIELLEPDDVALVMDFLQTMKSQWGKDPPPPEVDVPLLSDFDAK